VAQASQELAQSVAICDRAGIAQAVYGQHLVGGARATFQRVAYAIELFVDVSANVRQSTAKATKRSSVAGQHRLDL
jgi:hypothetical protein